MNEYTHKKGIVYKNQFHIIFCPKYRRKVLVNGIDIRLKEILYDIAKQKNIEIKALEIMPDHVHMFIEFDPRLMLHKIIKDFKGISSRILREEFSSLKCHQNLKQIHGQIAHFQSHVAPNRLP